MKSPCGASGTERPSAHVPNYATASVTTTHLLWADRWIEAVKCSAMGEPAWRFKSGRVTLGSDGAVTEFVPFNSNG